MDEELEEIRKEIDEIDAEIVDLLEGRVAAAKRIGALKKKKGLPLTDPVREKHVLQNALRRRKKLDEGFLAALFRSIIDYCKNEEENK